ncbi:glycosyltransferase 87 family protein [Silvibacterium dinghuense]|uniref:DUF2029 domain-containing protein n=1 Tax=Silvibacterium dinghuense TaxID=1560006 RepID=A0A4V1NVA3_9BACT|nr:glycosyltransferase 87 family protein [Silvibacterium dinghuense]RXS95070.1 DUF2029 domain-containing protein [Silvibacterium dinghuense]GGH10346.1 hypothetical protein GCM10011586_28640 [Silvibacterium dinghuense]
MTGIQTLAARGLLGLAGALATPLVARMARRDAGAGERWDRVFLAVFALSRLLLYGLVFGLLHLAPRGDIPAFYYPQALHVLAGQRPYRDFISSYAPLHSYLDAAAVLLWHSPLAIILLAVLAEIAMMATWSAVTRGFIPGHSGRTARWLYLVSPLSVMFVTVDGQNNVLIGLLLALAVLLALRERRALSGISYALSACVVKFLSLIYLPVFVLTMRRWSAWLAGTLLTLAVVYGSFAAMHLPIQQPLTAEGDHRGAGCLPYVIEVLAGRQLSGHLWDGLLVLALLLILGLILIVSRSHEAQRIAMEKWRGVQLYLLLHGMTAMTIAVLLLSKKSWPTYVLMALFPLCVLVAQSRPLTIWLFGLFQCVAVVEHSFWASILSQPDSVQMRTLLSAGNHAAFVQMGLEILLLAGYVLFLGIAVRGIRRSALSRIPISPWDEPAG